MLLPNGTPRASAAVALSTGLWRSSRHVEEKPKRALLERVRERLHRGSRRSSGIAMRRITTCAPPYRGSEQRDGTCNQQDVDHSPVPSSTRVMSAAAASTLRSRLRYWATPIILGLVCLLLYNANLREIGAGDTVPARYLPLILWHDGSLELSAH